MEESDWFAAENNSSEEDEPAPAVLVIQRDASPERPAKPAAPAIPNSILSHFKAKPPTDDLVALFTGKFLKTFVKILSTYHSDTNFHFSKAGLSLCFLNSAHVAMIHVKLEAASFPKYHCQRPLKIGVSLEALNEILTNVEILDFIEIVYEKDQQATAPILTMHIHTFQSKKRNMLESSTAFFIHEKTIDVEEVAPGILENPACLTLPTADFFYHITKLAKMGETVQLTMDTDVFKLDIVEGEVGAVNKVIRQTKVDGTLQENLMFQCTEEQRCKASFSLVYLKGLSQICSIATRMCVYMKREETLHLQFSIGMGTLDFYLASKTADE
jgi:proliferating cell nuclear antigen PCNA